MHLIAFLSQKGGSGKTTLAVHAAVAAHEAGEHVFLIDTDPQGSAQAWARVRKAPAPTIERSTPSTLTHTIQAAQKKRRYPHRHRQPATFPPRR